MRGTDRIHRNSTPVTSVGATDRTRRGIGTLLAENALDLVSGADIGVQAGFEDRSLAAMERGADHGQRA